MDQFQIDAVTGVITLTDPSGSTTDVNGNPISAVNLQPSFDGDAIYELDVNAFAAGMAGGNPAPFLSVPGTTVHCQWWGRDTLAHGPYLTAALEFTVCP